MQPLFDPLLSFDLAVFSRIQSIQNPVLTPILSVVSLLGTKGVQPGNKSNDDRTYLRLEI